MRTDAFKFFFFFEDNLRFIYVPTSYSFSDIFLFIILDEIVSGGVPIIEKEIHRCSRG